MKRMRYSLIGTLSMGLLCGHAAVALHAAQIFIHGAIGVVLQESRQLTAGAACLQAFVHLSRPAGRAATVQAQHPFRKEHRKMIRRFH